MSPGSRLLVTGASGFTGSYVIDQAKSLGLYCIALCRYSDEHVLAAHESHGADLLDSERLADVLRQSAPDYVVHLAAISNVAHGSIGEIYSANVAGTVNLLNAIADVSPDVQRVVIASSANLYGRASELPITENTPVAPVNHYGVSKQAMEQAASLFQNLPITVVRPFNYTGVGQSQSFLVPKVVSAFKHRKPDILLGDTTVSRDFSDVRDVASAYVGLLNAKTATYNICSGRPTSIDDIFSILESKTNHSVEILRDPSLIRDHEIKVLYGDPSLINAQLHGFKRHSLSETLDWMLEDASP